MPTPPAVSDYEWLVSDSASSWLDESAEIDGDRLTAFTSALRKELSAARTSLVLQQAELRRRARVRFELAERMFFTEKGLQQATDDRIGSYKASELTKVYSAGQSAADLCCGIGGDLMQFARHYRVTGYDVDEPSTMLATANAALIPYCPNDAVAGDFSKIESLCQPRAEVADVNEVDLSSVSWWHCDPDRRSQGRRTSQVVMSSPSESELNAMLERNGEGSMKLAPGAEVSDAWRDRAQLEWIGHRRECQQLWARFGKLAVMPGQATATTLTNQGTASKFTGTQNERPVLADSVGGYLFEPAPSVIAARLTGSLANQLQLAAVDRSIAYLTGSTLQFDNGPSQDDAAHSLKPFAVEEVLPFDIKRLKAAVRAHDIGDVEIKKRGVAIDPAMLKKKLPLGGSRAATLILFPCQGRTVVAITRRIASV